MKPIHQLVSDARTIRGIIEYLEQSVEPATTNELAMTSHVSDSTALRLCRLLETEGVVEHPRATRVILGVSQEVPLLGWRLTEEFFKAFILHGAIYDVEKLARGARP
jgi:DNA-binding transcriptional regulator YhcF (GntR family)